MPDAMATGLRAQALGWALVQFVWQGALVGVMTAIALATLRGHDASIRHVVACLGLLVMFALPVATAIDRARELDAAAAWEPPTSVSQMTASKPTGAEGTPFATPGGFITSAFTPPHRAPLPRSGGEEDRMEVMKPVPAHLAWSHCALSLRTQHIGSRVSR